MTKTKKKKQCSNPKKLHDLREQVTDFIEHHAQAIEEGKFVRQTAKFMVEVAWLIKELDKALADDSDSDDESVEAN